MKRRDFLIGSGGALAASAGVASEDAVARVKLDAPELQRANGKASCNDQDANRCFNSDYRGEHLDHIAFPLGGIGAGMFCIGGNGALACFSFRHRAELDRERRVFAAIAIQGQPHLARVLEGPVPDWKLRPQFADPEPDLSACWGLPRFKGAIFQARFPFSSVELEDPMLPVATTITAWSPFSPGDADSASLPVAGLEYRFVNRGGMAVDGVFSFNAENLLAHESEWMPDRLHKPKDRILGTPGGFILYGGGTDDRAWDKGSCAIWVDDPQVQVSHAWPLDSLDLMWREFVAGSYQVVEPQDRAAAGASLFVPLALAPGESRTVKVQVAWYVPRSNLFEPTVALKGNNVVSCPPPSRRYIPWYAGRFTGIQEVVRYWQERYVSLRQAADVFSRSFFDSTLPGEAIEAVAANLCILKSPTVLRQTDGRLWGWEGVMMEYNPGIAGTSTHVWNYAQSIPHLFPSLERTLRETEFGSNQNDEGLQYCRTPLPIRPVEPGHTFPDGPAADGQLGGIIKVYREWRISGDTNWLRRLWPRVRSSLDYCIRTWDPSHRGWIEEPHLTTYDVEFWGPDSYSTSLYLGALKAATLMAAAMDQSADPYNELLERGIKRMEQELFNGEYFFQLTQWRGLRASFPPPPHYYWTRNLRGLPGWPELLEREGPPGQRGTGCPADGVMGVWLSWACGIPSELSLQKVVLHLTAVRRYNFKLDLSDHTNLGRASFACGTEGGVLLCTWPRGDRPSFTHDSDEVWTGTEYQVASHLIAVGQIDAGLEIVRAARRRYDGRVRNPFSEVEAGDWYARAMSSYALLQSLSGARYDAVDKVLYLEPVVKGDFRSFLSTATGFGTVGVQNGTPFLQVASGEIPIHRIRYSPAT